MNWLKWAILITVTYAVMTGLMMWQTSEENWQAGSPGTVNVKQVVIYDNR